MKKVFSFFRDRHDEIYKSFLLLLCCVTIVYFFPGEAKFRYNIDNVKAKPWPYENLIAPFDFAISKNTAELQAEVKDANANAKLYFRKHDEQREKQFAKLEILLSEHHLKNDSKLWKKDYDLAAPLLDSVLNAGIVQPSAVIEGKPADFTIAILAGRNIETESDLASVFTIKSADEFFKKQIPDKDYLQKIIDDCIDYNLFYDDATTQKVLKQNIDNISASKGGRVKGQAIINKGEIVTPEKLEILESLKQEYGNQTGGTVNYLVIVLGRFLAVFLCLGLLASFLLIFRRDIVADNVRVIFILLVITINVIMVSFATRYDYFNIYFLPFCILPIIMRAFYDTRVALFTHLVTVLIIALFTPSAFEFVFLQLPAGIAAIFSIVNMSKRSQIFISAGIIFVIYCLAFGALRLIQDASVQEFSEEHLIAFAVSSALALSSFPLIYVFERIFGFVSDVTLMELCDTNNPLLRELATKAPGTFQHSLQVADLAEEVIHHIGGNVLLMRAGALYHDVGKTDMPVYFVENQMSGYNPHDELDFEESAHIIIGHVSSGIEKAKKYKLPDLVIDFIRTHHGTTTTGFFYRQYKIAHPEGNVSEKEFQYPGPIPFSKETATLMMCDAVEASARSLKKHDNETIDNHVESIINGLVSLNQFYNADITFRDLTKIKKILKKKLMNIYHSRPEYPQ